VDTDWRACRFPEGSGEMIAVFPFSLLVVVVV